MNEEKVTSAPTSCSAHGAEPAKAVAESSNSPFRATAALGELKEHIVRGMREAREQQGALPTSNTGYAYGFYAGEVFALGKLHNIIERMEDEGLLARNDKAERRRESGVE